MIKEIKNTIPWTCVINDLKVEEIAGMFYEKELKKLKKLFNFFFRKHSSNFFTFKITNNTWPRNSVLNLFNRKEYSLELKEYKEKR